MTSTINVIRNELEREEKEILDIRNIVLKMKEKVLDKEPSMFSRRDIINAVFGSLTIGLTFVLKGALKSTSLILTIYHLELIIASTFLILMAEIYYVGYSRVKDKNHRTFGEFMTKRLVTLYIVSMLTSFFLIYILNIDSTLPTFYDVMKMVILLAMPCSVGAAIPSLLKKY